MTQEDKELLLTDLCARLPYGVIVSHPDFDEPQILDTIFNYEAYKDGLIQCACDDIDEITDTKHPLITCRPYLRPMDSMTISETMEYTGICVKYTGKPEIEGLVETLLEFYCSHHLDFRGLIPKDLAIEAPEGMYRLA